MLGLNYKLVVPIVQYIGYSVWVLHQNSICSDDMCTRVISISPCNESQKRGVVRLLKLIFGPSSAPTGIDFFLAGFYILRPL